MQGRNLRRAAAALACVATVAACDDAPSEPAPPEETWASVEVRATSPVRVEDVVFHADGLRLVGRICRPTSGGRHAALVWNRGGFDGLGSGDEDLCRNLALLGYVVMMPEYRGAGASEGEVEVCLGEADDVVAMTRIGRLQPYVNPQRVVMAGASHGGCVTLRALQRGAQVAAAVAISAPTDWAALHAEYADSVAMSSSSSRRDRYRALMDDMEEAVGGSPSQAPAAYAARSPVGFLPSLNAWGGPLMLVHGTHDDLVLPSQACRMADAWGGMTGLHVQLNGNVSATPPSACAGYDVQWSPGPRPRPTWPASRYLMFYAGEGHEFDGPLSATMLDDALTFLQAKLP